MGPNKRIKALQQEKADLVQRMEAMLDAADRDGRDLAADEEMDYQELEASLPALDNHINREQTFLNAQASQHASSTPKAACCRVRFRGTWLPGVLHSIALTD